MQAQRGNPVNQLTFTAPRHARTRPHGRREREEEHMTTTTTTRAGSNGAVRASTRSGRERRARGNTPMSVAFRVDTRDATATRAATVATTRARTGRPATPGLSPQPAFQASAIASARPAGTRAEGAPATAREHAARRHGRTLAHTTVPAHACPTHAPHLRQAGASA